MLSSGTALFDWFRSNVDTSTPPPAKIAAQLTAPRLLNTHELLGTYLKSTSQSTAGLSDFELGEPGFEFVLGIHLQGDLGRRILLKWSLVDHATNNPLRGQIYNQTAAEFRPRNNDQEREWPIWVPSPPRRGEFVLRATLVDENEKDRPVDEADSKPFTLAKAPGG